MWSFIGNTLVSGAYFCHHVLTGDKRCSCIMSE